MRRILAALLGACSLASAGVHSLSCGKQDAPAPVTSVAEVNAPAPKAAEPSPITCANNAPPWLSVTANGHTHWACLREDGKADVFTESPDHPHALLGTIPVTSFDGVCPARTHESIEDLFGGACVTLDFADEGCPDATLSTEQRKLCLPPPGNAPGAPIELVLSYIDHRWSEVSPTECDARKRSLADGEEPDPNLCFDDDPTSGTATVSVVDEAHGGPGLCFVPEENTPTAYRIAPGKFEPSDFSSLCE